MGWGNEWGMGVDWGNAEGNCAVRLLCHTMKHIYQQAVIASATSHIGRRKFITTLASKGVGVRVLASLAGHRSTATTQAYIDVNDDKTQAALELVG